MEQFIQIIPFILIPVVVIGIVFFVRLLRALLDRRQLFLHARVIYIHILKYLTHTHESATRNEQLLVARNAFYTALLNEKKIVPTYVTQLRSFIDEDDNVLQESFAFLEKRS